jgi:gliding motility-associated-like protein
VRIFLLILFVFSISEFCSAQICTGSLGDPVVNINFGTGTTGSALSASTTNYTFTSNPCPQDGIYTVVNSSTGCHNNTWHSVTEDHTPNDNNGLMMVINASYTPGDFYVQTVSGLCENSTYEFSAWILNILKTTSCNGNGIEPNLTFNIETTAGTNLGKYETGRIPQSGTAQWKQYGLFFKTPAGTSTVVIRITNNSVGGCGNDIVLDDISFRPCGPTVSATVLSGNGNTSLEVCDTDRTAHQLEGKISTGYNQPAYQWQVSVDDGSWTDIPGEVGTSFIRNYTGKGSYRYRLTVAEAGNITKSSCRVVSNLVTIKVNEKPVINLKSNSPVCEGETVSLQSAVFPKITWTGPGGFTANANAQFIASPAVAGKYYVSVASEAGCVNIDSTTVIVNARPVAVATAAGKICEGTSTRLTASGGSSYEWSPSTRLTATNISSPTASPLQTTTYIVSVSNQQGCADTASVLIQVISKPVAHAGSDKKIMEGESVSLNGTVSGAEVTFSWTPAVAITGGNTLSPVVSPNGDQTYTLHAISNVGCGTATDNVFVRVFKKVLVPNAFSPNGDGINDQWIIEALETYPEAALTVFNRYGQQVYSSKGYSRPWNGFHQGKPLPPASYYYVIDLKNGFPPMTGWVMIVR